MSAGSTTRCCSALALIAASSINIAAQSSRATGDRAPLALFPVESVWTIALEHQLIVPPASDAAHVYFATDEGRLVARDLADGSEVWSVSVRPQQLAAGGGLVFTVEPDLLSARRASDGGVAWQVPFAEALPFSPTWSDGLLVLATTAGTVVLVHASDGQTAWRRDLRSPARAQLALTADRVYVPVDNGRIVSLRADTGETVWERRLGGTITSLVGLNARVYVGSTDNFLYCLNAPDGGVEWRWRTGADVIGMPVFDERNVYFVSLDNVLRALSRRSGVQQWFRPLPVRPTAGAIKAGATLIVPSVTQTLSAYDTKDGAPAGTVSAGDGDRAAPVDLISHDTAELPGIVIVRHDVNGVRATLVSRRR